MAALSDLELAGLDLLIEMRKSGMAPAGFINANISVNNLGDVAVAAASVAAVAAAVGLSAPHSTLLSSGSQPGPELSLQELMDVRDRAIQARKP